MCITGCVQSVDNVLKQKSFHGVHVDLCYRAADRCLQNSPVGIYSRVRQPAVSWTKVKWNIRTPCQCYFLNNSVKRWSVLLIFGMQYREETWHRWLYFCPPHLNTLPREWWNAEVVVWQFATVNSYWVAHARWPPFTAKLSILFDCIVIVHAVHCVVINHVYRPQGGWSDELCCCCSTKHPLLSRHWCGCRHVSR